MPATGVEYRLTGRLGGKGNRDHQFVSALRGLAIDGAGNVYAANDSQVTVFDEQGRLRRRFSTAGPIHSVSVRADGAIFTGQVGQIEIFDGAGRRSAVWRDPEYLVRVTSIGFAGSDVLAGDAAGRAIRRLDSAGHFRNNIGRDNPLNGLLVPNGVVSFGLDAQGIIHAANPGKHRVESYSLDGKLLGHIGHFHGSDPAGFGGCCNPTNVAVSDRIYVTEKAGPRAKVYNFAGDLEAVIAADCFDPNCKNMSIAAHRGGRVYVADTVKLEILVFEPVKS